MEDPVSFYGYQTIISHRYLKMNNNPICYYSGGTSMYHNFRECYLSHAILEIIHFRYQIRSLKPFIGQHKWIEYNKTFQHGNQIRMFPKVTVIEQLMYTFNFPSLFSPYFIHTLCNFLKK